MTYRQTPWRRTFRQSSLLRRTLRRRGVEIMTRSALLTGILLSTAYVWALSTYEASVLLRVEPEAGTANEPPVLSRQAQETLTRLVASREVIDGAADDPAVGDLPWFRDALQIEAVHGLPLIRIAARGTPEQAPRIVGAVANSLDRVRARSLQQVHSAFEDEAQSRLDGLRARAEQIEQTWKDQTHVADSSSSDRPIRGTNLHVLASERLAVRMEILEAEWQKNQLPPPSPLLDLTRLHWVSSAAVYAHPVGLGRFWIIAAVVATVIPGLVLGLAMWVEARKAEAEDRRLWEEARRSMPAQGPLLVAIQLVHGDWRTHPAP